MLRRGRDDRIHVLAFQQTPVVLIGHRLMFGRSLAGAVQIHVGHRHEAGFRQGQQVLEKGGGLPAHADEADADAVIRARPSCRRPHIRRQNLWQRGTRQQKTAPLEKSPA
jgi:hypothetical protein